MVNGRQQISFFLFPFAPIAQVMAFQKKEKHRVIQQSEAADENISNFTRIVWMITVVIMHYSLWKDSMTNNILPAKKAVIVKLGQ